MLAFLLEIRMIFYQVTSKSPISVAPSNDLCGMFRNVWMEEFSDVSEESISLNNQKDSTAYT
jgi:hypothetical protein